MSSINMRFGVVRPSIDAHSLGPASFSQLIQDCGYSIYIAPPEVCDALNDMSLPSNIEIACNWLALNRIQCLGYSYRLDPFEGLRLFSNFFYMLMQERMLVETGGLVSRILFAGLPSTCQLISGKFDSTVTVFWGDESPEETLDKVGVPSHLRPASLISSSAYDSRRLAFAKSLIESQSHKYVVADKRPDYLNFGSDHDSLADRIAFKNKNMGRPLIRAHAGPYDPNRLVAVKEFTRWARELSGAGLLDVLSIGTSQLSQEAFGEDWLDRPNGGGVPVNSPEEFREIWAAARPMLVRTYSGTKDTLGMAKLYDQTINNVWHALSLWWFCKTDGRGPNDLLSNLKNHFNTIKYIAKAGRPFEPNIPHHFSFRGADDLTYVVSAVLAARLAKKLGIRHFIFQNMMNTPKATWGVQDLAKARAVLAFLRPLKSENFNIYYQPRAGLDYFSHNIEKAKIQLAAVTALMDDVDFRNESSPDIIHVVSYSEAAYLATPLEINESIQITHAALEKYRAMKRLGEIEDMSLNQDVLNRTNLLVEDANTILRAIEKSVPDTYTPEGFYKIFWAGFLPVPQLWGAREEFEFATAWQTRMIDGGSCVVNGENRRISAYERAEVSAGLLRAKSNARNSN
jgi:hypothetical protein